jgi:hypothetical protein
MEPNRFLHRILKCTTTASQKKGRLVIKWDCAVIDSQLANMPFHMLSTNEQQYQWQIQHNNLQQIIGAIGTRNMKLAALGKALSLISSF